jgi:glycosyltransferase involved in cell wall biosynthesis
VLKIAIVAGVDQLTERGTVGRTPPVTALATALAAENAISVYVTGSGSGGDGVTVPGCRVVRLPKKTDRELVSAVADDPPDIVHTHGTNIGASAAERLGVPFVRSLHSTDDTEETARVIVPCTSRRSALIAAGIPRHRIDVVPYGVDVDHFTPDGPAAAKNRRHRIVLVGELTEGCGFASVVATLPALPDTELVIAGGPLAGVKRLRKFVRDVDLTDRVTMTGPITAGERPGLFRSADVAVCLPRPGLFDVTAVEAMACGAAVVATSGGGLTDTVIDGVTGVLVPPRDPHALTTALRGLLARPARCEQFGATGRDRAWARYSWSRIAKETLASYDRAMAARPKEAVAAG